MLIFAPYCQMRTSPACQIPQPGFMPIRPRGDHPKRGFMLHGDSHDCMTGYTRETKDIKNRPAVLVIYEP